MAKDVIFGSKATEKLMIGLDKAADAVAATIGPKGLNAYLEDQYTPVITNDGFSIAKKIVLADKQEDAGAYIIRNVAGQQNDDVGDGTTTVSVLTQAISHEILKRPENKTLIKESLLEAQQEIVDKIKKVSTPISKAEVKKVALISSEDERLASLIGEIVDKLGEKAVISVEDSKTFETSYEIAEGYEAKNGFANNYFITDNKTGKAELENVPVLVSESKIANIISLQPILQDLINRGMPSCVFVCDDIDDAVLGTLILNKMQGKFNSIVIKSNAETLRDIAGATGATLISPSGLQFKDLNHEHLGRAKKVISDINKTIFFVDGQASKEYAEVLEANIPNEDNQFRKKRLEERIARLRGGIAVLKIAAPTDFEREYLKFKAEDAVKATLAALEEGIVEGGGMTLWRIAEAMAEDTIGRQILKKALTAPFKKILENAGKDYGEIVRKIGEQGYNAKTDEYVDLIEAGIIDPAKVERVAVQNSISAAATVCTMHTLVTEHEDRNIQNRQISQGI